MSSRKNSWFHLVAVLLVFSVGIVLLSLITLKIRKYNYSGEKIKPVQIVEVYLEKGGGLTGSRPVRYKGMEVGTVRYVQLISKDGPYKNWAYASLELNQKIPLYADASAKIKNSNFIGNPYIELFPGTKEKQPLEKPIYKGEATPALFEALGKLLEENRDEFQDIFRGFQEITEKFNADEGSLQKLLSDETLMKDIENIGDRLTKYFEEKDLGSTKLLSKEFRKELETLNEQIEEIQKAFNDVKKSSLGALISEKFTQRAGDTFDRFTQLRENFNTLTKNFSEGKGLIPQLLIEESKISTEFRETWKTGQKLGDHFQELGEQISKGEAGLFSAINDPEIRQVYEQIAEDFNAIGNLVEAGEGSLSKFYNDETLLKKTRRCLRQLSEIGLDQVNELPLHALLSQIMGSLIP